MNDLLSIVRCPRLQSCVSVRSNMKMRPLLLVLALATLASAPTPLAVAAEQDGVAIAIIYDTSGSMRETVRGANGRPAAKYVVANRALADVARQIQTFATNRSELAPRTIHAGMFIFEGEHAREVVKFGPFNAEAFENFARRFSNPNGNTPLGNSLSAAVAKLIESPLPRKHVLVITDGLNTVGPKPEKVMPGLKEQAAARQTTFSVHFVAFDVDAKQFAPLKKLGATVVGAANEAQLNAQLQFILQRKILLEDEEPPQKK